MGRKKIKTKTSLGVLLESYRTLSYTWRHAIGEIVDNSVDSYLQHKEELPDGIDIRIKYNPKAKTLLIIDNAFGMNDEGIESAVQVTRRHGKNYFSGGIGQYGLGLKKAATCLGDKWKIITLEKGNGTKYTVPVDVMQLYKEDADEVDVLDTKSKGRHGTRVEISLRKNMRGAAEKSVMAHLAEMYRFYIDEGDIRIHWNDEQLEYEQPETRITKEKTEKGEKNIIWWTLLELNVPLSGKKKKFATVTGELYILASMSNAKSGLQLFHKKRMVVGGSGSPNENWRPTKLVGGLENYRARRLCGALHLDMLKVNHQKDGFAWNLFDQNDLEAALINSKVVKSFLEEASKQVGPKPGPGVETVAKNIRDRLGSKSVNKALDVERATKEQAATKYPPELVEQWAKEAGEVLREGKEPIATVGFNDMEYGPIMTSCVTGQEKGHDLLRILINKTHRYYETAIGSEEEKELWIEFIHALALTEHTLSGVENLDFDKIVETLGKFLSSFRASDK